MQIRSLLIFGHTTSSFISRFVFGGRLKLLKALHLEDASLAEFPGDDVTTNLFFLRYLRLGITPTSNPNILQRILRLVKPTSIPSSLGKLVNLETLEPTQVQPYATVELPDEILKLTRLRNLLSFGGKGLMLPKEIGRLTSMENLMIVNGSEGIDGRELGKLTRLRTLLIKSLRGEDATLVLASVIEKMKYLRYLRIEVEEYSTCGFEVENVKCAAVQLQFLCLHGIMKDTPYWILSLDRLLHFGLVGSQIKDESFFNGLQLMLPNLVKLRLGKDAIEVAELCFHRGSFPILIYLELLEFTKLKLIKVEEGAMPCILTIALGECQQLKNVQTGIEHLTTLKEITLYKMSKHFVMAIRTHCWKAGHSPAVNASGEISDEEENINNSDEDIRSQGRDEEENNNSLEEDIRSERGD